MSERRLLKRMSYAEIHAYLAGMENDNDDEEETSMVAALEELEEEEFHEDRNEQEVFASMAMNISSINISPGVTENLASSSKEGRSIIDMDHQAAPVTDQEESHGVGVCAESPSETELPVAGPSTGELVAVAGPPTGELVSTARTRRTVRYCASSSDDEDEDEEVDLATPVPGRPWRPLPSEVASEEAEAICFTASGSKKLKPLKDRSVIPWDSNDQGALQNLEFRPKNPGLQVNIPKDFDELAALTLFMRPDIWEIIAAETNRKYRNKLRGKNEVSGTTHPKKFIEKDVTPAEARAYIGIMILLGLKPPSNIYMPWKPDATFRVEVIASMMSLRRFRHIHLNFHLVDNDTLPPKNTIEYKLA